MGNTKKRSTKKRLWQQIIIQIFLAVMLISYGCSSGGGGGGGGGGETPAAIEDSDGDGLTDAQENEGWEIHLDLTGDGNYETRQVTSNPESNDSDGDGLTDDVEKNESLSDPMSADSDGDGLNDYDEIRVYWISPVSVDSDRDSIGDDPDHPETSNRLLWDGSEVNNYHCNPSTKDTDGDGMSDYHEIVESDIFNPAVADFPEISIELAPDSLPKVYLDTDKTDIEGLEEGFQLTESLERGVSYNEAASSSTQIAHNINVKVGGELDFSSGFDAKVTGELGYDFNHATTKEVSWGSSKSTTAQETYQKVLSKSRSSQFTVHGGSITTGVKVKNTGDITFTLNGLGVAVRARESNEPGLFTEVMTLSMDGFESVTLGPNEESSTLQFTNKSDSSQLMLDLIRDPSTLNFEIASFDMVDEFEKDFDFYAQNVEANTAPIIIDYGGDKPPERYFVATILKRDANGEPIGITLGEAMRDILKIPFSTAEMENDQGTPYQGLSSVGDVERDPANRKVWMVVTTSETMDQADPTNFEDIVIKAEDRIHLIFVSDSDGDKLSDREEFIFGTSDEDEDGDTDNDGLSDYDEVMTGWWVPYAEKNIYSDPTRGDDYDEDGLTDTEERDLQTDPFTPDTDKDGIFDAVDPDPNDNDGAVTDFEGHMISDTAIELSWTPPTDSDSFGGVVILRQTTEDFSGRPTDGTAYTAGNTVGSAEVIYAGTATSFTDAGLAENTEHYYRLFAWHTFTAPAQSYVYAAGLSALCSTDYRIENVKNLIIFERTDSSITLKWDNPVVPDGKSAYKGVVITRMDLGTFSDMTGVELTDSDNYDIDTNIPNGLGKSLKVIAIMDNNSEEYTDTGLDFKTRYGYKLFSFDEAINYSAGEMKTAETLWGKIDLEVKDVKLVVTKVDDWENIGDILPDLMPELWHRLYFRMNRPGDASNHFHIDDLIYTLSTYDINYLFCSRPLPDGTPGCAYVRSINIGATPKVFKDVDRSWVPGYKFHIIEKGDLGPLWELDAPHVVEHMKDNSIGWLLKTNQNLVRINWNCNHRAVGYLEFKMVEK